MRTVIGVMPPKFAFPIREALWTPLSIDPLAQPRGEDRNISGRAAEAGRERVEGQGAGHGNRVADRTGVPRQRTAASART
jgi:hypothetical protein